MQQISPRLSAGFSMFAASKLPPEPPLPAPMIMCISSMNTMLLGSAENAAMICFIRSSKSPRNFVPATSVATSRFQIVLSASTSGTSPSMMRLANPSTITVLPTPGSPVMITLCLLRRATIWQICSTSRSRPIRGSMRPACALALRLMQYCCNISIALFSSIMDSGEVS